MLSGRIGAWNWFFASLWSRILNMLELNKRCWQVFIPAFVVLLGLSLNAYIWLIDYRVLITIILLTLAIICLIIGITAFVYDIKDARRQKREAKAVKDYEDLKESFRKLHPEWTEEQLELATRGR